MSRPKGERDVEERMDEWLYGEEQSDIETVRKLRARYLNDVYFHTAVQHLIRADSPQYVVNVLARLTSSPSEPDKPWYRVDSAADDGSTITVEVPGGGLAGYRRYFPSERASTAADGGWQDGEWDDALRAAWAVVVEAAQDSSLWGGTVASAFRAIHKRLDAAVQPPSVAKALVVWRRHAEDAEEWAAISDLEKALAHPSPSAQSTRNETQIAKSSRPSEPRGETDNGADVGVLEALARLERMKNIWPDAYTDNVAADFATIRQALARPESREGADELHDLIAKGYVEEAAQKARSMASARLSRGPLNE